jgi:hypothetical protein
MKTYTVYLAKKETHHIDSTITVTVDGYLTALAEAHKLCALNYIGLYVARVEANK